MTVDGIGACHPADAVKEEAGVAGLLQRGEAPEGDLRDCGRSIPIHTDDCY